MIVKSNEAPFGQRRRHVRFVTTLRVEYDADGRKWSSFTSAISSGGLLLRGAKGIEVGQNAHFNIVLSNQEPPVAIDAIVRRVGTSGPDAGIGFEFLPDQEESRRRIRDYLVAEHLPKLEAAVNRNLRSAENVLRLAAFYLEIDRPDDSLKTLRKAVDADPGNNPIVEALAWLLLVRAWELGTKGWPMLTELDSLVATFTDTGPESFYTRVKAEAAELAAQIDRCKQDEDRRVQEQQREQAEKQLAGMKEHLTAEIRAELAKPFEEQRAVMEASHARALAQVQQRTGELDSALAQAQQAAAQAARFESEAAQLRTQLDAATAQAAELRQQAGAGTSSQQALTDANQLAQKAAAEADELSGKLRQAQDQLAKAREELDTLKTQAAADTQTLSSRIENLTAEHGRLDDELSASRRDIEQALDRKDEEIARLTAQLRNAELGAAGRDSELETARTTRLQLEQQLTEARSLFQQLATQKDEEVGKLSSALKDAQQGEQQRADALRAELTREVEKARQEADQTSAARDEQILLLTADLKAAEKRLGPLEAQAQSEMAARTALASQLAQTQTELRQALSAQEMLKVLEDALDAERKRGAELQSALAEASAAAQSLSPQVQADGAQLAGLRLELAGERQRLAEETRLRAQLSIDLEAEHGAVAQAQAQLATQSAERAQLQEQLTAGHAERAQLQEQLVALHARRSQVQEDSAGLKAQCIQLQGKLTALEQESAAQEKQFKDEIALAQQDAKSERERADFEAKDLRNEIAGLRLAAEVRPSPSPEVAVGATKRQPARVKAWLVKQWRPVTAAAGLALLLGLVALVDHFLFRPTGAGHEQISPPASGPTGAASGEKEEVESGEVATNEKTAANEKSVTHEKPAMHEKAVLAASTPAATATVNAPGSGTGAGGGVVSAKAKMSPAAKADKPKPAAVPEAGNPAADDVGTRLKAANRFVQLRDFRKAIDTCLAILAKDPQNAKAYRTLGVAYGSLSAKAQACESYRRYLRFASDAADRSQVEGFLQSCK